LEKYWFILYATLMSKMQMGVETNQELVAVFS